jgi:chemotaxis methyl-accepting protein methylase
LWQARGLDLTEYRRSTLESRLAARMANQRLNNPGGYLVLGLSESLPPETASRLIAVDRSERIFQKPG